MSDLSDVVEAATKGLAEAADNAASKPAYEDRNLLALTLAVNRKRIGCDAGYFYDDQGCPVVWAVLPTGQVSWNLPPRYEQHIEDSCLAEEWPVGGYDGHDRQLKNTRLAEDVAGRETRVRAVTPR
ncbi:hypothetical protein [Haloarchaeobius salinus]|uniref:hypothetical protein n=1 Tax=Haloarchaeobius salinus TaxID=1198298 RepID=UPI00210BDE35|nr:hypothetical protein [Haloarchaeobius salinus]